MNSKDAPHRQTENANDTLKGFSFIFERRQPYSSEVEWLSRWKLDTKDKIPQMLLLAFFSWGDAPQMRTPKMLTNIVKRSRLLVAPISICFFRISQLHPTFITQLLSWFWSIFSSVFTTTFITISIIYLGHTPLPGGVNRGCEKTGLAYLVDLETSTSSGAWFARRGFAITISPGKVATQVLVIHQSWLKLLQLEDIIDG